MNFILKQKIKEREDFFADDYIKNCKDAKNISVIAIVHLMDTGVPYVNVLKKYFSLEYIIPKPKSINKELLSMYPQDKILSLSREKLKESQILFEYAKNISKENKLLLLGIGGYFANSIGYLEEKLRDRFLGVIEDTENGHQKYLTVDNPKIPIISVARSPLKSNEDHLVGQSVIFSADAILRKEGINLNNKKVGVIGFGKIGNGVLSSLRDKGCRISVYDNNPVIIILAISKGYNISSKLKIIEESSVIICSTGNLSLKNDEFKYIKNGAFIISVTSSDDELDLSWLKQNYKKEFVSKHIDKYDKNGHYFYLLNNGNAINFIHGAVVDDFILLVQKEMIDTIVYMNEHKIKMGIQDGFSSVQERVADSWLKSFTAVKI